MLFSNKGKSQDKSPRNIENQFNHKENENNNNNSVHSGNVNNQFNRSQMSIDQDNVSIDMIKLSNEIMKKIEITEKYPDYFADRYSDNSYKNFLRNIIEYKYNLTTLSNILKDIQIKIQVSGQEFKNDSLESIYSKENTVKQNLFIKNKENLTNKYQILPNKAYNCNSQKISNGVLFYENNPSKQISNNNIEHQNNISLNNNKNGYVNDLNQMNNYLNYDTTQKIINSSSRQNRRNDTSKETYSIPRSNRRKTSFENERNKNLDNSECKENPNFEKLLRSYNRKDSSAEKKRPFNRFTKVYGNFFDKNLLKKNGPPTPMAAAYEDKSPERKKKF